MTRYPFGKLRVGSAFIIPRDGKFYKTGKDRIQAILQAAGRQYGLRHGVKFTTRITLDRTGICVVRVK